MKLIWDKSKRSKKYPHGRFVPASQYRRPARLTNVMPDIDEFVSPIDNSIISSRSYKRAHMRHHGVEEVGNEKIYEKRKPAYEPKGLADDLRRTCEELNY